MAIKHHRLRRPWFKLWMGGISLIVLWLVPLGVVIFFAGLYPLGLSLIGLISSLLLMSLFVWGEVAAQETCTVFGGLILDDQDPGQAEAGNSKHDFTRWQDVILWMFSLPGLEILRLLKRIFQPNKDNQLDWLGASYLMLPIISLEHLRLGEATERIKQLIDDHMLRFHPNLFAIRPLARVTQWVLALGGGLLGFWIGLMMANPSISGGLRRFLAAVIGTLLAGILTLLGISFSSFIRACYYTTLYHWALSVEAAHRSGDSSLGKHPAILGQVMRKKLSKKE